MMKKSYGHIALWTGMLCILCACHFSPKEEQAMREALQTVRTADKAGESLLPYDSLIDVALRYFHRPSPERATALLYKACLEDEVNHSEEAILHLQEGLHVLERYPEERETKRICLGLLGDLYYQHKLYDKSLEVYQQTLAYCETAKDSALTFKDIGSAHVMTEREDSAFFYNRLALRYARQAGDSALIANYLHSLALTHNVFQHPDSALLYARRALAEAPAGEPKGRFCYTLGSLLYDQEAPQDTVAYYMQQAVADTTFEGRFLTLLTLSDLAEEQGRHDEAIDHLYAYIDHIDSLYTAERGVDVQQLVYEYDTRLQVQRAEARSRQALLLLLGLGILLVAVLTVLYLIYYYRKQRQVLLARQQLERSDAEINALKTALSDKDKALTLLRENTLNVAKNKASKVGLFKKLEKMATKEERSEELPVLSYTDRENLKQEVGSLFTDYIREQQEACPALTDNDLYYLCLTESGLPNRAIAIAMGYSDLSGVRQIKRRVKEKMSNAQHLSQ